VCGREADKLRKFDFVNALCSVCAFEHHWLEYRHETRTWAQESLRNPQAIILETKTTGFTNTDTIIEIAIISADEGKTLYNTLIQTNQPIQEAAYYHHFLTKDKLQSAPLFPAVWRDLSVIFDTTPTVISYNADFHSERLWWTAQQYGITVPALDWQCLMKRYAAFYGKLKKDDPRHLFEWQTLFDACRQQGTFVGVSNRALTTTVRVRRLLQALAETEGKQYE
jgi:DNA polymerase III epsilon subunit-like protein